METQTTTEPIPIPLAAAITECVETFNLLVCSLETPIQKPDGKLSISVVKNQRDRLRIWATNIGVLGHGKASLDVEMTGSSLTKITILNLLTDLDATLLKSKSSFTSSRQKNFLWNLLCPLKPVNWV